MISKSELNCLNMTNIGGRLVIMTTIQEILYTYMHLGVGSDDRGLMAHILVKVDGSLLTGSKDWIQNL